MLEPRLAQTRTCAHVYRTVAAFVVSRHASRSGTSDRQKGEGPPSSPRHLSCAVPAMASRKLMATEIRGAHIPRVSWGDALNMPRTRCGTEPGKSQSVPGTGGTLRKECDATSGIGPPAPRRRLAPARKSSRPSSFSELSGADYLSFAPERSKMPQSAPEHIGALWSTWEHF